MSAPQLPGPSDAHERSGPSPVDSPYTSARSQSGHLIPYSPAATRGHSQGIPWMGGGQTSFHDEPNEVHPDTSQVATNSNILSGSGPSLHHGDHASSSDILTSGPSGPLHRAIGFAIDTSPGTPELKSSPRTAHFQLDANKLESHRSRTPLSVRSSQPTISSRHTRNSVGRASYREHHGPRARVHTPSPNHDEPVISPSPTLRTAEPSGLAAFPTIVALPRNDGSNQPGEPTNIGPRFYPMSVTGVLRYDCRKTRGPSKPNYTIQAMLHQYPETPDEVPDGWTAYRHPEGALYFVHNKSKTFVEVNICDEEIYMDIEHFRTFLFSELKTEIKKQDFSEPLNVDEVQLVLEPKLDDIGLMCCYYFVNPRTRCLFWLDEWDGYEIFKDLGSELTLPHKGLGVQAHYWCSVVNATLMIQHNTRSHWDYYPNFCEVTQELKDEVVDMILHATCDHLTSNRSSCPLNPEDLEKYLRLVERIDPAKTEKRKHSAIIIGRIMHIFYNNYFLNYYGEDCARLNFDQSVHGWRYYPSRFMSIIAVLSFMAPMKNVRLLHKIFVDDIASREKWNTFVANLNSQLQETSVLATVLLNANVAFLPKQSGTGISPQEFLSYMSLVASVASIILGLVFMGHSRTEARNTAFKAATFLHGLWHERHGLETLAIVYSLPHVFLMWGMVLFSAAFAVQWCYPDDTGLRVGAGAFMFVIALLVAGCIWTARDQCDFWWFQPDPNQREHPEDEKDNTGKVSSVVDFLPGVKKSLSQQMVDFIPGEKHAMQDTPTSLHEYHL